MGLFKDFKEDFSQAVNEMMPGTEASAKDSKPEELVVNTLGEDVDVKKELSKLTGTNVFVSIVDIKKPDLNAKLVADSIAKQISNRASFRIRRSS